MDDILKINAADNVAVALRPLAGGTCVEVGGTRIEVRADVPAGHKLLLDDLPAGADVVKYGFPIGHLRQAHGRGEHIDHRHIETNLAGLLDYDYRPAFTPDQLRARADCTPDFPTDGLPDAFMGYRRRNGDVGVRNEVWIVPTVGCVNGVCQELARRMNAELATEGGAQPVVAAFTHNYGCSQLGDDHEHTRAVLRDLVLHPNAGGVLVVGLGCENNQPGDFMRLLGDYDAERVKLLVTQEAAGDEVDAGMELLRPICRAAAAERREPVPLSELRVGLKCGGSDGFSGITANPLLGALSDYVAWRGGTCVLTEVPEMFGAETILMSRCATRALFDRTVRLINDFKAYYLAHGEPVGENPSPGNKAGGISTLEEKALGCTQKCGKSAVRGVLGYGERLASRGLNLLSAPGNDLVASTALAAAGCHMVLFTTGRGTPFGTFVPTLKVSTNTQLAQRRPTWIDFDAGTLAGGEAMADAARRFVRKVVAAASGEPTWNERKGYREIAIFKTGVTL